MSSFVSGVSRRRAIVVIEQRDRADLVPPLERHRSALAWSEPDLDGRILTGVECHLPFGNGLAIHTDSEVSGCRAVTGVLDRCPERRLVAHPNLIRRHDTLDDLDASGFERRRRPRASRTSVTVWGCPLNVVADVLRRPRAVGVPKHCNVLWPQPTRNRLLVDVELERRRARAVRIERRIELNVPLTLLRGDGIATARLGRRPPDRRFWNAARSPAGSTATEVTDTAGSEFDGPARFTAIS